MLMVEASGARKIDPCVVVSSDLNRAAKGGEIDKVQGIEDNRSAVVEIGHMCCRGSIPAGHAVFCFHSSVMNKEAFTMNLQAVLFGLIEFILTIALSFVLVFLSYRFFLILTPHFDEEAQLKKKNVSIGIALGSVLLGEAVIIKQAIYPVMAVIQLYALGDHKGAPHFLETLSLSCGFVIATAILAIVSIYFCFWLFNMLTPRINQFDEIKNGNTAVAVFMALFVVGICLLLSSGISALARSLIPFPQIGSIPLK